MSLLQRITSHGWVRRPYVAFAVPLALPLLLASGSVPSSPSTTATTLVTPPLRYNELTASPTAQLPQHALILTMEDGDTLDDVLTSGGLTRGGSATLTRAFNQSVDVR